MNNRRVIIGRPINSALVVAMLMTSGCSIGVVEKHWKLAEQFSQQGQHLRAIEEYTRVVNFGQRSPLAIRAQFQIGQTYEETLKEYPRAIRAYRDAFRRADDDKSKLRAQWAIARIYAEKLDSPSAAADEYKQLFQDYGRNSKEGPQILMSYGKTLMDAGRFSEAAKIYQQFRESYPGHKEGPRTVYEQGQAELSDRHTGRAVTLFQEVVTRFGGLPGYESLVGEAYYGLGNALEANGEMAQALEAYRQSLSMYPNRKVIELKIDRVMRRKKERQL